MTEHEPLDVDKALANLRTSAAKYPDHFTMTWPTDIVEIVDTMIAREREHVTALRAVLAEAVDYLKTAPFNYANGVEAPGGMADEGTVRGMEAHNRLIKRLQQALES